MTPEQKHIVVSRIVAGDCAMFTSSENHVTALIAGADGSVSCFEGEIKKFDKSALDAMPSENIDMFSPIYDSQEEQ